MLKRFGLFMLTNILVIVTVSAIMYFVLPALGIEPRGYMGLAIFCGIFGMGGAFISLQISRWMAKKFYNIQVIDRSVHDSTLLRLRDMVVQISRQAGLKTPPEVGVYVQDDPNAFATGPSKEKSIVAFSTGLLQSMSEEEVRAVAAHEVSHIANGDMVTMTLLTGISNALVMFLARIIASIINNVLSDEDGGGLGFFGYIVVVMLLETVLMLLAAIPLAWFSRQREYRADAGAAKFAGPGGMISALQTLKQISESTDVKTEKDSFAMAKISSRRRMSLWSTHPPLEDRIARLSGMRR